MGLGFKMEYLSSVVLFLWIEAHEYTRTGGYVVVDEPVPQHSPQLVRVMLLRIGDTAAAITNCDSRAMWYPQVRAIWTAAVVAEIEIPAIGLGCPDRTFKLDHTFLCCPNARVERRAAADGCPTRAADRCVRSRNALLGGRLIDPGNANDFGVSWVGIQIVPASIYSKMFVDITFVLSTLYVPVRALHVIFKANPFDFETCHLIIKVRHDLFSSPRVAIGNLFNSTAPAAFEVLNHSSQQRLLFVAFCSLEFLRTRLPLQFVGEKRLAGTSQAEEKSNLRHTVTLYRLTSWSAAPACGRRLHQTVSSG